MANQAGEYVEPSIESATAAAAGVSAKLPANTDFRISIVNAPGKGAYPITSFTWLLVPKSIPSAKKHKQLTDFLRWYLTQGETSAASLDYAPLPEALVTILTARIDSISAGTAP
jgi:phosphate transport system substrate-binding protein